MKEQIEEFIKRRFPVDCNWMSGNCYHFAVILNNVFGLPIAYLPVEGHFVVNDGKYIYDYNGAHLIEREVILFLNEIKESDINWYNNLVRDCVM